MIVHHTKCTITHTHVRRYIYTCIMHNAITQSEKINQTLPTFQANGPEWYRKSKQTLPYLGNTTQARTRKIKGVTWIGTLIHALEKTTLEGLGLLIY